MRAATYTRFSLDKQDRNSTAAQLRNCTQLIEHEGWQQVGTYADEAITGSDNERPDYRRLLADAEAGKFDVIVLDETSRFTRAPGELQRQLALLKFRGQFLVDCRGFDSRQAGASLIASVANYMDEQEVEKIIHRTRRGQREVVEQEFNPGGRAYGYSSEPVRTSGKRRWRIVVVPGQAEIVDEIFKSYADGSGLKAIAESLNARGTPSPGSSWRRKQRRCRGWLGSTVRAILLNERYTGKLIWNRTSWTKVPFTSRRIKVERPRSEWVVRDMPALAIVSPDTWQRVQARFAEPSRREQAKAGRARRGRPPRHLLSGLMVCGRCGAAMIIESRGRYACSSRTNGGASLCDNHLRVDHAVAEEALLSGVQRELLSDDMVAYMQRRVRERIRDMRKQATSGAATVQRLQSELRSIGTKLERVADAVEQRGYSETLEARLTRLEQQKAAMTKQLDAARRDDAPLSSLPDIIPDLVERYRDMVGQIALLGRNRHAKAEDVDKARRALSALLGPVHVEPRGEVLVARVTATGARLVESSPASINRSFVVAGAGFEPATFGL